jgi:hypothetical protein
LRLDGLGNEVVMFKHVRREVATCVALFIAALTVAAAIPPAVASEPTRHIVTVAPRSTISDTIPAFYFDATDGLPATVVKGNVYSVSLRGMATAGTGGGTLTIVAVGGTMSACKATAKEITPVTLKCTVKVTSPQSLVLTASGATKKFPTQTTKFAHAVRR